MSIMAPRLVRSSIRELKDSNKIVRSVLIRLQNQNYQKLWLFYQVRMFDVKMFEHATITTNQSDPISHISSLTVHWYVLQI